MLFHNSTFFFSNKNLLLKQHTKCYTHAFFGLIKSLSKLVIENDRITNPSFHGL